MRSRVYILTFALAALAALSAATLFATPAGAQDGEHITSSGVAGAIVGSTVDELIEQLGDEYSVSDEVRITVDYTGHVVSRDGTVQFRAVKANEPGEELNLFIVNNPNFMTAEGVGPGTTIADAEEIYGEATLNRNPENESREFIEFENQGDDRIAFRTPGIAGTYVGEYDGDDIETTEYDEDGVIAAIWVSCRPGLDCPGDAGASAADTSDDDDADEVDDDDAADDADDDDAADDDAADDDADEADDDAADDDANEEEDDQDDDAAAGTTSATTNQQLPETGTEQIVLVSIAATFVLLGGFFVLVNRNFLAPAWLGSRRW